MDHQNQQDGVNLTRALEALSPYINNPRQTVVRIEGFVLVSAGLLFLQLLLGSIRRWCGNWFVQGALWVAYTASFPLITYTLGQMVSSPIKNALYPLWAVFLFWAAGCTHSIIAYDLEDNKSWKRHFFELIQYNVYLTIIVRLLIPISNSAPFKEPKSRPPISIAVGLLAAVLFYANVVRLIAGWMVTNSAPSKFVADYMRKQVAKANQPESLNPDPVTMKGYKYLVRWHPRKQGCLEEDMAAGILSFENRTIDKIWEIEIHGSLLNSDKGSLGVKDVCLAFALSHLLKRRYFEMECAEANCPETRKFVLEGLLLEKEKENGYTRAFQIIEVELGFLYDFFFTKYATLFHMEVTYLITSLLKLISIAYCGVLLLKSSPTVKTLDPIIEVGTRRFDVIITIIIMASFLIVEALQLIFYMKSDWATVSLACLCIRFSNSKCILSLIRFLQKFRVTKVRGYWQNKMGQSSAIASSMHFLPLSTRGQFTSDLFVNATILFINYISLGLFYSMIFSGKTSIKVTNEVKRRIVSCLKEYKVDDPLTNGQRALSHHRILDKFSWTLENQSQASIMLVWHIATEYCNMAFSSDLEKEGEAGMFGWHQICCGFWTKEKESSSDQKVATTLSRYCAYLMSSAPDLLPGNSTDTLFVFESGLWQGRKLLRGRKPSKEILLQAIQGSKGRSSEDTPTVVHDSRSNENGVNINVHDSGDNNIDDIILCDSNTNTTTKDNDIFTQGLKLGRQLEEEIEDEDVRWRVMVEFWAETIIYIAPSDNAKAHMERLAQGGEYLTHVWALLTHAGILQRDKKKTPEDTPIINV